MKIAVDFDDVILDTVPEVLELLNACQPLHMHNWTMDDITRWDMSYITGFTEEKIFETFGKVKLHDAKQIKDAVFNILDLSNDGHIVEVVTSNPREAAIRQWMDVHRLEEIVLVSTPDKITFLKDFEFDVLIDDNPDTLVLASAYGIRCIRFVKPWNTGIQNWGRKFNERSASRWYNVWNFIQRWVYTDSVTIVPTKDDGVITNSRGGKQTDLKARYDLLPALAVKAIAGVLERGAKRYGEGNWHSLSVEEIHNHTLGHAIAFNRTNDIADLEHTACRALMALEIALREEKHERQK